MKRRVSHRRRWNYYLCFGIIAFIGILNLPTVIKTYLIEPDPSVSSPYPHLLNPEADLQAMHFSNWSIVLESAQWVYQMTAPVQSKSAKELSHRWQQLVGTEINLQTYAGLAPQLKTPNTIEVWYQDQEEPQRITYYQLPDFWLLKNWNDQWLAVSIEESYLFPSFSSDNSSKSDD